MQIRMMRPNQPIGMASIEQFARARSLDLPSSYVDFLLATNGGVPERTAVDVQDRPHSPIELVQSFLGVSIPKSPTDELSYAYDLYAPKLPADIVPIANQDGGNYFCLDLRHGRERIVFWDKAHFWSTGEWREEDLYPVADTFEEFLSLLKPSPY